MGGRPARHFSRQKIRHPSRCQRTMVDGRTFTTYSRRSHSLVNSARLTRFAWSTRRGLTPLHAPCELPWENQILRSDRRRRAKEQHAEPHHVGKKTDDRSQHGPHVHIMPDSAADSRHFRGKNRSSRFLRATLPSRYVLDYELTTHRPSASYFATLSSRQMVDLMPALAKSARYRQPQRNSCQLR